MQANEGYASPRFVVKMEAHSPVVVPRSLSPVTHFSSVSTRSSSASSSSSSSSSSHPRLKLEYTSPSLMDPYGYDQNSWTGFGYEMNHEQNMNGPQPFTIFPAPYVVSQGNPNQANMIQHQQWNAHPQAQLQYSQPYYSTTPSGPGQTIPGIPGPGFVSHQEWAQSPHRAGFMENSQVQQQHIPNSTLSMFPPVVPSSSLGQGDLSDNDTPSIPQPTLSTRYNTAMAWLSRTSPQLTPAQVHIAQHILSSSWWETERAEPELRANDVLVVKGLITPGGSRFRAFLEEEKGWMCTFDHDGVPCQHGKGRLERALGTIRGFFMYKPVLCGGACGSRCDQRFVSVEQCQKHAQKKRSGRAACQDCGSSILPANMSRHRRSCHAVSEVGSASGSRLG